MPPRAMLPLALATLDTRVPEGRDWVHEEKLDGYRIEAVLRVGGQDLVRLYSRNSKDWTARFPTIAAALAQLPVREAVLDGEIIAAVPRGTSAFQALQRSLDPSTAGGSASLRYCVFDLLHLDGTDLRAEPLRTRLQLLRLLLRHRPARAPLRGVKRFAATRGDVLAQACAAGLEGVVCKRLDAPYRAGRHRHWLKVKCGRRQEFVIVGYTEPRGSRTGFGALLLGVYDADGTLCFAGKVGTGFDTAQLAALLRRMRPLAVPAPPVHPPPLLPRGSVHWIRPTLVGEVSFTEWTAEGALRHPVFQGLREDKPARAVRREEPA